MFSTDIKTQRLCLLCMDFMDWGFENVSKKNLQMLLNNWVRFILPLSPAHSIHHNVLISLKVLNDREKRLRLNYVYNIYPSNASSYIWKNFISRSDVTAQLQKKTFSPQGMSSQNALFQ